MNEKTILIVETNPLLGGLYAEQIWRDGGGGFSSIVVTNPEAARDVFHSNKENIVAVVTAGRLNGAGVSAAYELVREFRTSGFRGPIIANSSDDGMNEELLKAGASYRSRSKEGTTAAVLALLTDGG